MGCSGTATTPGLNVTKNFITFLGLTNDHRNVVLADNRGNQQGAGSPTASNNGYVIIVSATGFQATNLTILNYCNIDYEYPGNSAKNLTKRSPVITQAVALQASGDKHAYDHVAPQDRQGLLGGLLGALGASQGDLASKLGLASSDPSKMSPDDAARLMNYARTQQPEVLKKTVEEKPWFVKAMGNPVIMGALAIAATKMLAGQKRKAGG